MQRLSSRPKTDLTAAKTLCLAVLLALACGCAKPPEKNLEAVFYPPPPNPARVQFLKSISSSKDVEAQKKQFSLFLVGAPETSKVKDIRKPYGITYAQGKLYVCDMQTPAIVIMDLKGQSFEHLQGNMGYGKLKKPVNVAVDQNSNIFVVDISRKEVLMFDSAGKFSRIFGKGIVNKPVDVAVDATNLYVLDAGDNDIKILDRQSGEFRRSIGKTEGSIQGLSIPTNITSDGKGVFYTTNVGTNNIVKLDRDGHILDRFGKMGSGFGDFVRPKGIAVGREERIFIVDGGHQNVQIFNDEYRLLMFFGDSPSPAGMLNLPAGIATTTEDLDYFQQYAAPGFILEEVIFVTNQMGSERVSIFGLGQMAGQETTLPAEEPRTAAESR